jgi:hypothetical protein
MSQKQESPDFSRGECQQCPGGKFIRQAIKRKQLQLETINSQPFETKTPRLELIKKVKKGELPKGILKNWPLYLITPQQLQPPKSLK